MNTDPPIFSILMASFNQAKYIQEAIESLLQQDFESWELLIQDAGSTDGSLAIIDKYSKLDSRITVRMEKDSGPADALNKALHRSSGLFVGCLNSDDFYLPKTLWRVWESFSNRPSSDIIFGHGFLLKNDQIEKIISDKFSLTRFKLKVARVVHQSTFYRRDSLVKGELEFNPENNTCWDSELLVDAAQKKLVITGIEDYFGIMRLHSESITGSNRIQEKYFLDQERLLRKTTSHTSLWFTLSLIARPAIVLKRSLKAKFG